MGEIAVQNKERSAYWDNIKGILILFVVFAHVLYQLQYRSAGIDAVVDYIYMFHMPAFIFVSGYFGKSEKSRSFESIIKLVFLYFIFNSVTAFIEGYTLYLKPIYSYWYLIALIAWRLTAHRLARFKLINIILIAVALLAGFFPAIDNTFAAARILCFYPFYMLGYSLSEKKSSELINRVYVQRVLIGTAVLLGAAVAAFGSRLIFNFSDQALQMFGYEDPLAMPGRVMLFIIAILAIYALRCFAPDRKLPLITMFGRNSLWIFVFHRLFTKWLSELIADYPVQEIVAIAAMAALILCAAFGNDFIAGFLNKFLSSGARIFTSDDKKITVSKIIAALVALGFVVVALFNSFSMFKPEGGNESPEETVIREDVINPAMTETQQETFDNAFRITFAGDLILLEDQVKRAYNGTGYDFTDMFEYAKPYISSADMAIGVFEGPMAGEDKGYSYGNFDDNKWLRINFPDEFAYAVKDAGFDLVSTANNHMLDKGEEGALRTLEVLDKAGLDHTGTYKDLNDKNNNRIKIVETQGMKIAVLSYTFESNYTEKEDYVDGPYSYLSSIIFGTSGEQFEKLKAGVEEDFREAKALSPDLIVVLPHIGTQFVNSPDEEQEVWFGIFKENGADIILGDHPHVVQPVVIEEIDGRTVFSAYCPGNFANIYREDQGDTSMLIDVYIDRDSKQVIGGSIVPLYTYSPAEGNFKAVPVYEIMNNPDVRSEMTTDDIDAAANAHDIITKVVFGQKMDVSCITERYYFDESGYLRTKNTGLTLTDDMKNGLLYKAMSEASSICFVGDSVTEGTKNGGCPWYEPIEQHFPDKVISNYSKGSCTVSYMLERIDEIPVSDLYVIALGTNDVRYRHEAICAMTSEEYIKRMNELKSGLVARSPGAKFVFIAPWYSTDGDPYCPMTFEEKTALNREYSDALKKYCSDNGFTYINANGYIEDILMVYRDRIYLIDHIHPNSGKGVVMYSEAVLLSGPDN